MTPVSIEQRLALVERRLAELAAVVERRPVDYRTARSRSPSWKRGRRRGML